MNFTPATVVLVGGDGGARTVRERGRAEEGRSTGKSERAVGGCVATPGSSRGSGKQELAESVRARGNHAPSPSGRGGR